MDELEKLFSMLEVLRKEEETYNKKVLEEGPSFQYTFGFLLGEYNQGNKYILNIIDMCIPRSKKDIGALKKGQSALKRGQLKNCQI